MFKAVIQSLGCLHIGIWEMFAFRPSVCYVYLSVRFSPVSIVVTAGCVSPFPRYDYLHLLRPFAVIWSLECKAFSFVPWAQLLGLVFGSP